MTSFFALGLPHGLDWLWIALIFFLLLGPKKLPELARGLGRSLGEFKKAKSEFDRELQSSMKEGAPSAQPGAIPPGTVPTAAPVVPGAPPVPPAAQNTVPPAPQA